MRRLFVPLIVFVITIAAVVLTRQANDDANPGDPSTSEISASLGSPVLSVRRAPEWLRRPTTDNQLGTAARLVLDGSAVPEATCLGIRRGAEVIADHQSDVLLVPGELQRLVTIAALGGLGAGSEFSTAVVRSRGSVIEEGVLTGDLYIIGSGDPVLATAGYTARFGDDRVSTSLEDLADDVIEELVEGLGVLRVEGRVIGDESKYTIERDYVFDETWTAADRDSNVVVPLSALLVNDGYVWDPANQSVSRTDDPAAEAAAVFQALLEEGGLEISDAAQAGDQPESADQLAVASVDSAPLSRLAARALIDGTTAEMLFKETGVRAGTGAARDVAALFGIAIPLGEILIEAGLQADGMLFPVDGSGLSVRNQVTCDFLLEMLGLDFNDSFVQQVLPAIADTTLAACAPSVAGEIRVIGAAQGLITALAGRYTAENGDVVIFALIANAAPGPETEEAPPPYEVCNPLQASLLEAIAGHPYGRDLEVFGPLAVVAAPPETDADS